MHAVCKKTILTWLSTLSEQKVSSGLLRRWTISSTHSSRNTRTNRKTGWGIQIRRRRRRRRTKRESVTSTKYGRTRTRWRKTKPTWWYQVKHRPEEAVVCLEGTRIVSFHALIFERPPAILHPTSHLRTTSTSACGFNLQEGTGENIV